MAVDTSPRGVVFFLLAHSTFYHNGSKEFFSAIDPDYLEAALQRAGFQARRVFTLVDDCYDVFARLTERDQLWEYPDPDQDTPFGVVADTVVKLGVLLEWRAAEVAWAEQLARRLGVPHFLVAVKHPVSVLADLAYSSKRPIYISHPITAVRELLAAGRLQEAERIKGEINELTSRLRTSFSVVPLSPTAIDELRVRTRGEIYLPQLGDRWPVENDGDLLFVPPAVSVPDPLEPPGGAPSPGDPLETAYSGLLTIFVNQIRSEINRRDRKLVEQTRGLIVYRPYYGGKMSFGVLEEVEHRNDLEDHGILRPGESPCVALSPREDLALWRPEYIVGQIRDEATRDDGGELHPEEMGRLRNNLQIDQELLRMLENDSLDGPRLRDAVERTTRVRFRGMPPFRGPLDGEKKTAREAWTAEKWEEIARNVNTADWIGSRMRRHDCLVRQSIPVARFVQIAEEAFA